MPACLIADLRVAFSAAMDGLIAAVPRARVAGHLDPPSPQLVNNVAAVVAAIRHHVLHSPQGVCVSKLLHSDGSVAAGVVAVHNFVTVGSTAALGPVTSAGTLQRTACVAATHNKGTAAHHSCTGSSTLGRRSFDTDTTDGESAVAGLPAVAASFSAANDTSTLGGDTPRAWNLLAMPFEMVVPEEGPLEGPGSRKDSREEFAESEAWLAQVAHKLHDLPEFYAKVVAMCHWSHCATHPAQVQLVSLLLYLDGVVMALEDLRHAIIAFTSMLPTT